MDNNKSFRNVRWFVIIIVLVFLSACAYGGALIYFDTDKYQNKAEFIDFASHELGKDRLLTANGSDDIEYTYDTPFSMAVRKDITLGDSVSNKESVLINSFISKCQLEAAKADQEEYKKKGDKFKTPERAIIIDTSVTESGTGAVSVAVYCKMYKAGTRKMELESSDIETLLLSEETYNSIEPIQALNITYKDRASQFVNKYFERTYSDDEFCEGWESYLDPDNDDNYENFIMTKEGIEFFFDEGTVIDKSYGVVSVDIPYFYMDYTIREAVIDRYIDPNKPMVAITYDDGPGDKSEKRILKCLEKNGSVATFFYVGYRVDDFAYNGKKAVEIGCEIGNHSWDHPPLTTCNKKQIRKQIGKTNDAIKEYIGVEPTLLRPPYGDFSDRVEKVADMPAILWTIDTLDWKTRNPKKIFKSVKNTKHLDGKIILMHSIYDETADATEKIVPWLKKQGIQTVTVSELIKYKTGEMPKVKVYRTFKK
ncbi:MAG: polysaccharide deacetylase family protein [Firmicutes bacterium]|nr:polysaccharide deacetylase family protein [Bacillota bacterium]